jgi:ligand-binding sensor domain-containing protein/signal transduction histidine kinase
MVVGEICCEGMKQETVSSFYQAARRWQQMVEECMITIRKNRVWGFWVASWILLCILQVPTAAALDARPAKTANAKRINARSADVMARVGLRNDREKVPHYTAGYLQNVPAQDAHVPERNLKFTHLTTNDGLSQGYVTAILQDRRGFMWFATRDGLNRYDGNTFVVYKNNPNDPTSLSSNFIQALMEDDHGDLWIATDSGVNRFDPRTERCTRYFHEANNPNTIGGAYVTSIVQDQRGYIWFGTFDSGLSRFDRAKQTFSHYHNDSNGQFVGRIMQVIAGSRGDIWFVGERGLFHLDQATGQITRPPATRNVLSAENLYEDEAGNLWMVASSPIVALVKYDRQAERDKKFPMAARAAGVLASTMTGGSLNSNLAPDGQNGLWVPSSDGLYYFDRRTERFTYRFQHDETDRDSLDSNAIMSVYHDKGGVLWVGTENAGLNLLNFQQEQFGSYGHRPADPHSLSPGRVKAIYQDTDGLLWVGLFPRAMDRVDRTTGKITHYGNSALGHGTNVDSIYRDAAGYLWVGGGGSGIVRFDERTGRLKHYRHNADHPNSLISDNVYAIYGDRNGRIWVGQEGGVSRFDPATDGFANYRPVPDDPASFANTVWIIYQDRSGTLWFGTWGGMLSRFDDEANTFVNYVPDSHDPHKLNGGGINAIHEDRTGTLWLGTFDGLYRFNRGNETFTRYTESQGLPSSTVRCILEDGVGKLWLSTQKGLSQFDPQRGAFRNYDVSDGLQSNEFSTGCFQSHNGEMFFGGTNGFNALVPENVRDSPHVPPVTLTSLKIFNKPIAIGAESVLQKAIQYTDSLTLSYRDNVFSFEFAALSYANSQKNRYRYKLEGLESTWNEVGSKQRLATYTNLDPGKYVFRVEGANSDGVWNEAGVSLPILITPPWWGTSWFRAVCAILFMALLWVAYQLRVRQLHHQFEMRLEARVAERTRIARELHDTLLQKFQGLLPRVQAAIYKLPSGAFESCKILEAAVDLASEAITEGRDAVQGLRLSTVEENDLAVAIRTIGEELAAAGNQSSSAFEVVVQGRPRNLYPVLRDEVYRIGAEALRNAFQHAWARQIEVEIGYGEKDFTVHVRDDGKGIDREVLSGDGRKGHFGMHGMRERAELVGGKLVVWSELESGTEVELSIPASKAYTKSPRRAWIFRKLSEKETDVRET